MNRYDPSTPCSKCGRAGAATRYDAACGVMRRFCACGYSWSETPLDATVEPRTIADVLARGTR